jgi:hypothetical protein
MLPYFKSLPFAYLETLPDCITCSGSEIVSLSSSDFSCWLALAPCAAIFVVLFYAYVKSTPNYINCFIPYVIFQIKRPLLRAMSCTLKTVTFGESCPGH